MKLCNFRVGARWRVRPQLLSGFCSRIMFAIVTEKQGDDLVYRYEVPEHEHTQCGEQSCVHNAVMNSNRFALVQIAVPVESSPESP